MRLVDSSFVDESSSDEEFDLHEEEDIAMLVAMHKGKKPKHGGSVYGRAFIRRERIDAHKWLMQLLWITTCFPGELLSTPFQNVKRLLHPHLQFREAAQSSLRAEKELCRVAWP